ncbi:hypothetical protein HRbin36_01080 [bacterium HR36]|nr:hypothetical protein HRbin36_01080 [bacterium HR36]
MQDYGSSASRLPLNQSFAFQRPQVAHHAIRRTDTEMCGNLPHRRNVAVLLGVLTDKAINFPLPRGELVLL